MIKNTPRTERHLATLEELTAFAMDLARIAGQAAIADPNPANIRTFIQLTTTVRQLVTAEAKLATPPRLAKTEKTHPQHNPQKAQLARLVHAAAKTNPDAPPKRDIDRYFAEQFDDQELQDCIAEGMTIGAMAFNICKDLNFTLPVKNLSDEYLKPFPKQPNSTTTPAPPDLNPTSSTSGNPTGDETNTHTPR